MAVTTPAALAAEFAAEAATVTHKVSQALAKTGFDVAADARQLAPVDTGNLRGSIGVDVGGTTVTVGPEANYGIFVERGTWKTAPQPFLTPAAERREPALLEALAEAASMSGGTVTVR